MALLTLVRCRSLEATRYQAPGEWGRLLGLDRLPEVRTLRKKIALLCASDGTAAQWQSRLSKEWMEPPSEEGNDSGGGLFYVDGHVRVYHGSLTALPRRYVARQRLCMRGTTDYWVNGLGGEPFFVTTALVNGGLIAALRERVVPRLLADAPAPAGNGVRFTVIFDREGYSPQLFAELKEQGVAILTYHKNPGEPWPRIEFSTHWVTLHTGEVVSRDLAERGTRLNNGPWVREVRVLHGDGSQSSILTTHMGLDLPMVASRMAARWSQENFLKYMREHFGLDRMIEHGTAPLPESTCVVNPARRRLEADIRRARVALQRSQAKLGALGLPENPTPRQCEKFETAGAQLREAIADENANLEKLKSSREQTPKKITLEELPESERFAQLCPESKHFIDTIKMIAYRAESALAGEVREFLAREDDARSLLRMLFLTTGNLRPDYEEKTLTVELHRTCSPLQDAAISKLCETLTATETCFPTTNLRLVYRQMGSN